MQKVNDFKIMNNELFVFSKKVFLFCLIFNLTLSNAQTIKSREERLAWWQDARFGMFIHWGVFAVPAGVWKGEQVHGRAGIPDYAEWLMYNKQIPCAEYQALAKQFTASKFDPATWLN